MFKRNLWKIVLSCAVVAYAITSILPLQDTPFAEYMKSEVGARHSEFEALMRQVDERVASDSAPSEFVALKQIASEQNIDLSGFFPQLKLESSLRNIEKRNDILLDHLLKQSKGRLQLGLDLKGGVAFTLQVADSASQTVGDEERREQLDKAIEIIGERINGLGVAEPIIRPVGTDRIEVQLPSVSTKDNPEIVDSVKKPARLDFRRVHPFLTPDTTRPEDAPPGYEAMTLTGETRTGETYESAYYVKRIPEMTGKAVQNSFATMDEYGRYRIILRFTKEGSERFAEVTGAIAEEGQQTGRPGLLAIVLDGRLYSAPQVRERINSDSAEITGQFTQREAIELANVLNNPLDLPLEIREQYEVGPSLAADAVQSGKLAFIISTVLTIGFVVFFYTFGGFIAALGMAINVLVTLGVLSSIGATLTMPGIAGIVLTLAMSVDSNILIFERMREELRLGKSLPTALEAGFDKAWSAILDSNVTTLMVALVMIWLGTGPVKGFGVTLAIGIFTTMFAAVVVSKLLLEAFILTGAVKKFRMFSILQNTNYDFLKYAKPSFILSWTIVLVGVGVIAFKGSSIYGIDFTGGDQVTLTYQQTPDVSELRAAAEAAGFEQADFSFQTQLATGQDVLKVTTSFERGEALVEVLQAQFPEAGLQAVGTSRIGPSVGEEIQWNAVLSVAAAIVMILLYVAFRFEMGYGIGAVVSTIHDLLITVGVFVLFDRQFNASMVAAILLIAGYSINDTIVVFDRIREELKLRPDVKLREIVNRSLNLTLGRTVITGGTTLMTAITLIIVTGGEVNDIAFTLLIGVITGTFSSLYIASPIFFWWHKGDRRHVEQHQDVKPTYEWTGASRASQ